MLMFIFIWSTHCLSTPFFGINCDLIWEPQQDWPKIIEVIKTCGIESIRIPIRWTVVEPTKGNWQFNIVDEAVHTIPDSVEILATLMSVPAWANGTIPGETEGWYDTYMPKHMKDWSNFVEKVVSRYKHRIKHWEIWNEQNGIDFFRPYPNPKQYKKLLKVAFQTAKRIDPESTVVLGGLQMNGIIPSPWSSVKISNYLEDLYRIKANKYFDVCNLHPYVLPDEGASYMMDLISDTIQLMNKYGDTKKKLWITEVGCGINENDSPEDQAQLLKDTYQLTFTHPRIERVYWFLLRDTPENILGPEETMGLVTRDFQPKPALDAYREIVQKLRGKSQLEF